MCVCTCTYENVWWYTHVQCTCSNIHVHIICSLSAIFKAEVMTCLLHRWLVFPFFITAVFTVTTVKIDCHQLQREWKHTPMTSLYLSCPAMVMYMYIYTHNAAMHIIHHLSFMYMSGFISEKVTRGANHIYKKSWGVTWNTCGYMWGRSVWLKGGANFFKGGGKCSLSPP